MAWWPSLCETVSHWGGNVTTAMTAVSKQVVVVVVVVVLSVSRV